MKLNEPEAKIGTHTFLATGEAYKAISRRKPCLKERTFGSSRFSPEGTLISPSLVSHRREPGLQQLDNKINKFMSACARPTTSLIPRHPRRLNFYTEVFFCLFFCLFFVCLFLSFPCKTSQISSESLQRNTLRTG